MNEAGGLNPRKREVQVGIRELHTVSIWPLSFGDEMEVTDSFIEIINKFLAAKDLDKTEILFVTVLIDVVKKNIHRFLKFVTDYENEWKEFCSDEKDMLKHIDNCQLADIVGIIVDVNFGEDLRKKASSLIKNVSEAIVEIPDLEEEKTEKSLSGEQ